MIVYLDLDDPRVVALAKAEREGTLCIPSGVTMRRFDLEQKMGFHRVDPVDVAGAPLTLTDMLGSA